MGYTLLTNTKAVDQEAVQTFLKTLRAAGIQPDEVITDDSRLYPSALAEIWPTAVHHCACSTPRVAWSEPSTMWSSRFVAPVQYRRLPGATKTEARDLESFLRRMAANAKA